MKLVPPSSFGIDAMSLPVGMIIRSTDRNDYVVSKSHAWELFRRATQVAVYADNSTAQLLVTYEYCDGCSAEDAPFPEVRMGEYLEKMARRNVPGPAVAATVAPPRTRGRPRKHPVKEAQSSSVKWTEYNAFFKQEMQKFKGTDIDPRNRMKLISQQWQALQACKKSITVV